MPATNAGGGVTSTWMLPMIIEDNVIAFNGYLGLPPIAARTTVLNPNTTNEQVLPPRRLVVLSNSMFCKGAAPTLNDQGDADDGPAFLSELEIRTSADGIADFSAIIPANSTVTATATQLAEDGRPLCTSEFSQAVKSGKP